MSQDPRQSAGIRQTGSFTGTEQALRDAIQSNDVESIKRLLDQKVSPDTCFNPKHKRTYGMPMLHYAAERGYVDMVKLLLQKKATLTIGDEDGKNPLHLASEYGQAKVVRILLAARVDPRIPTGRKGQKTPLHLAAESSNNAGEVIKLLLEAKADLNASDESGSTPLHVAAAIGNLENVSALLEADASITHTDVDGNTALAKATEALVSERTEAVISVALCFPGSQDTQDLAKYLEKDSHKQWRENKLKILQRLLAAAEDKRGATPAGKDQALSIAVAYNHWGVMQLLLSAKADVNKAMCTALGPTSTSKLRHQLEILFRDASFPQALKQLEPTLISDERMRQVRLEKMQLLLENKANPSEFRVVMVKNKVQETESTIYPLHWAVTENQLDTVDLLLRCNADLNTQDENGLTPLTLVYGMSDRPEIMKKLLENKAELQTEAVLAHVIHKKPTGYIELATKLIGQGAAINGGKENALQFAARNGDTEAIQFLLKHEACVDEAAENELTPLQWAVRSNHIEAVQLLLSNKANLKGWDIGKIVPEWNIENYLPILEELLAAKANPNSLNESGDDSLLSSVITKYLDPHAQYKQEIYTPIITTLLKHKANPNLRIAAKSTALKLASTQTKAPWYKLLKKTSDEFIELEKRCIAFLPIGHRRAGKNTVFAQLERTRNIADLKVLGVILKSAGLPAPSQFSRTQTAIPAIAPKSDEKAQPSASIQHASSATKGVAPAPSLSGQGAAASDSTQDKPPAAGSTVAVAQPDSQQTLPVPIAAAPPPSVAALLHSSPASQAPPTDPQRVDQNRSVSFWSRFSLTSKVSTGMSILSVVAATTLVFMAQTAQFKTQQQLFLKLGVGLFVLGVACAIIAWRNLNPPAVAMQGPQTN